MLLRRSRRRLILAGVCLVALCGIAILALQSDNASSRDTASSGGARQAAPLSTDPVAVGQPATATAQATSTSAKATAKGKATASARPSASSAASAASASTAAGRPAAQVAVPQANGGPVFGVSDPSLTGETAAVQVQQLTAMKAMGISSVRLDASWYWGEPTANTYNWAPYDQDVASIQQVGLSADLIIDGAPAWAAVAGTNNSQWAQPASASQFASWAAAVASRYGPKGVKYFEIWNEPNLADFWVPSPNPAAYTADLKAAYAAIKGADPSAVVLSGGLAPATTDGTNYDPRTFLTDMYADGAAGSFDELGFHPYSYPDSPDTNASWSGWSMMNQTTPSIRSIMNANGDSGKKIWITEYGAPTSGPNSVGESGQSTDLTQAITQAKQSSWIGSLYLYTWADIASLPADQNGFGLLTNANGQKPSYSAVSAALTGSG